MNLTILRPNFGMGEKDTNISIELTEQELDSIRNGGHPKGRVALHDPHDDDFEILHAPVVHFVFGKAK